MPYCAKKCSRRAKAAEQFTRRQLDAYAESVEGQDYDKAHKAAVEVLLNTPHIQELITKGDVLGVKEALKNTAERGMQNFDTALYALVKAGRIGMEEALANADSRTNLEARINFS